MNSPIKVSLKGTNKVLKSSKKIGLGKGHCIIPFKYKGKEYQKCIKNSDGDKWCATEVDSDGTMQKYALCISTQKKVKLPPKTSNSKKVKLHPKTSNSKKVNSTKKKKIVFKPKTIKFTIKKKSEEKFSPATNFTLDSISDNLKPKIGKSIIPTNWELPNRKIFSNWFNKSYSGYRAKKNSITQKKGSGFDLFNHQKLVRDFINLNSPYRGLLLFHGLGVGKTCASIGMAEAFRGDKREIIVLLNKSLKKNFRVNLMKCGFEFYRINSHWVYHTFIKEDSMYSYGKHIGIPLKILRKGGAWFIDFSKKSNYAELSQTEQETLNEQIEEFIDKKYKFLHIDGLNKTKLEKMVENRAFDNKLLIIDEAHNLTNAMSKAFPGVRGKLIKQLIMDAENFKIVLLSGTPMINNLFETAQLFNLLRGYIISFNFILTPKPGQISLDSVVTNLKKHKLVDQVILKKSDKIVSVTRAPYGFINNYNSGFSIDKMNNISNDEFIGIIKDNIKTMNYDSTINLIKTTALPDNEQLFMSLFYNPSKNLINNPNLLQSRIMGLVSYFRTQDTSLIPTVTKDIIEHIDMSDYQFINYSLIRKNEIDQDKKKKKNKTNKPTKKSSDKSAGDTNLFADTKSSYRAYSRMHCSFVFPENHNRPYPNDLTIDEGDILNDVLDKQDDPLNNKDEEELKADKKLIIKKYEAAKVKVLKDIDREKDTLFKINDENQLPKYSPKYNSIINKINSVEGNTFIYTEYKTLEGIAVLQIILKANGFAPFLFGKNSEGEIIQVFENEEDRTKPLYAFWGGNAEESDIIRKVYNNELDELPPSLKNQIISSGKNNLRGHIIKVLMTTKTGAEGIDLHNVRQVHIVEPYWNPVRTQQVKGRAVRVGSHIKLPKKDQTVEIYTYISKMTKAQLKTDKTILDDMEGKCSDEVLHDISQRKLQVMTHLLQLIKEVSIDCSINIEETKGPDETLKCFSYGTSLSRDNYSFIPNISRNQQDTEIKRTIKKVQWKPVFMTLKGKKYAVKKTVDPDSSEHIFDYDATKSGQPGNPIGELIKEKGKVKRVKFYK